MSNCHQRIHSDKVCYHCDSRQGLVTAEVISNNGHITGYLRSWDEIILWNQDESAPNSDKTVSIATITKDAHWKSQAAFVGLVKPGIYRLGLLSSTVITDNATYRATAFVPKSYPLIEVKANSTVDLGRIFYHKFEHRTQRDKAYSDYVITWSEGDQSYMDGLVNKYKPLVDKAEIQLDQRLSVSEQSPDVIKAMAQLKAIAAPMHVKRINGDLMAMGRLGLVKNLASGQTIHLGDHSIHSLIQTDSGYLAGNSTGQLFEFDFENGIKDIRSLGTGVSILGLNYINSELVILTTQEGKKYEIQEFNLNTLERLSLAKQAALIRPRDFILWKPLNYLDENNLVYFSKSKKIYRELATKKEVKKPLDFSPLYLQGNGVMTGNYFADPFAEYYISEGNTKTKMASMTANKTVSLDAYYLFNDGTGIWVQPAPVKAAFERPELSKSIIRFSDSDKEVELPSPCNRFAKSASKESSLIVICMNGDLFESADKGKSWKNIYNGNAYNKDSFIADLKIEYLREAESN